ncbi:uncharacterized protein EDB93DRAFT_74391 [Suillus bovinus]|uniref:uncharacterized protein n=1 Tax=Suillus bovinus TaxID=48563 RepID=UPI001B86D298|nr:uncharacterized protein EDB93DRAFT_74391 [Suillus bovinus]KAG2130799.1 hypothetical protein EDB93DRAFT_74391 [Suillus bovinus]
MDGVKHLHQQLVERKDKITQSMHFHKGLLSPLWRLPAELLSEIFHHCLPEAEQKIERSACWLGLEAPMLFTGICRRWKEVATSTPSLWCRLHIEVTDISWQRVSSCYDLQLKWSRGLPLSLAVQCYKDHHSTTLRRLLHPYMHQISSLYIFFFFRADKPQLLLTDLPALEELTIYFNDHVMLDSVLQFPSTMRRFTAILPSYQRNNLGLMWAHLTDLAVGEVFHPAKIIEMLQLCPNLSSLAIRSAFQNERPILEPITHTSIQSLRIDYIGYYDRSLCSFFRALSLPNLRFLEVRLDCHDGIKDIHRALKALLKRSGCALERLTFGIKVHSNMTDKQRAEYTTLIPSLEIGITDSGSGHRLPASYEPHLDTSRVIASFYSEILDRRVHKYE